MASSATSTRSRGTRDLARRRDPGDRGHGRDGAETIAVRAPLRASTPPTTRTGLTT
jgi:hypothetical protein